MGDPAQRRRGGMLLRLGLLGVLIVSGFLLVRFTPVGELFDKERMIDLLQGFSDKPWAPAALFGLFSLVAVFGLPASPVLIGGGVVFGRLFGSIYNVLGLIFGAMVGYFVGKALGREALVQLAGPKLKKAERLFEKRGFWPLVQVRFLPVPFSIVGYAAALAGVSTGRYFITSTIGLLPATLLHTWFAPTILLAVLDGQKPVALTIQYAAGIVLLNVLTSFPQIRETARRRRRYRELKALRAERAAAKAGGLAERL
ncbi:MAG: VTT domain-containing protein [Acidobacteriota bacterium]